MKETRCRITSFGHGAFDCYLDVRRPDLDFSYLSLSKVFHFHSDSTFVKKVSESLEAKSFKSTGKVWGGICRPRGAFAPRISIFIA